MPHDELLLATRGLTKAFGPLTAVDGVSLGVRAGDVYGFLGLNGAGKTTTIRMILGLIRPTRGEVEISGRRADAIGPERRARLGAMVEGPAFYPRLSGLRNLMLLGSLGGRRISASEARAALARVGLEAAADRPAGTYSLGMKQRLGIALALAPEPRIVILDEPTNGLDPRGIRDVRELILRLNREEGLTFLVSSHLLVEVEQVCNRVGIIRQGRLVFEGATEDLLREGVRSLRVEAEPEAEARRVIEAAFGAARPLRQEGGGLVVDAAPGEAPALARALVAAGVQVRALVPQRPTLEELFLDRAGAGREGAA